jgi:hypothetical protein
VEELGAGSRTEGPKAWRSACSRLLEGHDRTLVSEGDSSRWT